MVGDTVFKKFVERVLSVLGDSRVQQFHLSCLKGEYNQNDIFEWISRAFRHGPEKIKLYCPRLESAAFDFTQGFNSVELELHLNQSCSLKIPSSFTFSCLKVLDLNEVSVLKEPISGGEEEFHLGFDVLEVLNLVNCEWENVETINIHSPKLRNLSIRDGNGNVMPDTFHEWNDMITIRKKICEFSIRDFFADVTIVGDITRNTCDCSFKKQAPRLDKLASCGFSIPNITLLGPATVIDLCVLLSYKEMDVDSRILKNRCELLTEFSNAKSLTISSTIIKPTVDLPTFHNLVKLKVDCWQFDENLFELLHYVPVLEFLTVVTRPCISGITKQVEGMIPRCVTSHLKVVQFDCYYYSVVQWIELPRFLLRHASVLEKLFIKCRCYDTENEVTQEMVEKELAKLPKSCSGASVYLT